MFDKKLAFVNKSFSDKWEAIQFLIDQAKEGGKLLDDEDYKTSVLKREEEYSTAVGYGIAIPHGSSEGVNESFVAVATLKEEMLWGDEKVNMIFMIGVPQQKREMDHLKILAWLSKNLMHNEFRSEVLNAEDEMRLYNCLSKLENLGGELR